MKNSDPSAQAEESATLSIGWAEVDITPLAQPVLIAGQLYARLSEGVADPLKASACALESRGDHVVFVCCDLVYIPDELRDAVRRILAEKGPEFDPMKVILNATHTHTGAQPWTDRSGIDLGAAPVEGYVAFLAQRIADCVEKAWNSRAPGGVAFGLDYAVVGRNRRWTDSAGVSTMYRLKAPASESFRHIEGYEDHSLNLVATYGDDGRLTGLIVNLPCPSQEEEKGYLLSADFWHETRKELRQRFGERLFILTQVSAAGDLTSHNILEAAADQRMLQLKGIGARQEIACRIADAVGRILPCLPTTIDRAPLLVHRVESVRLPANRLTRAAAEDAGKKADGFRLNFEREKQKLEANPDLRKEPRWYRPVTEADRRMRWNLGVVERYEQQQADLDFSYETEVHLLRLGEIAFATNPFEYYLDFGVQIKVRSPAIQTFLVQLAGSGTYVPSPRSVVGGGYGSVPASNPVGPEGGQILAENTIRGLRSLWNAQPG